MLPGTKVMKKTHSTFHKNYTQRIQFKGWRNERVIHMSNVDVDGVVWDMLYFQFQEVVIMMEIELGEGWIFHKFCKMYLFVSAQRVVGCLVAEPIEEAFRVVSCSVSERCNGVEAKKRRSSPTTLQFGNIILQREFVKRAPHNCFQLPDGNHHGAIICGEDAVPAACGVRAIWITPSNRRRGIATQLLDAMRKSFCTSFVLSKSQLALSQPTSAGKALAFNYTDTKSFLVYQAST
ncbi:hypothetical protein SLE2022_125180 [Rubroshorea leprosula]